jgi:hypothetical protein
LIRRRPDGWTVSRRSAQRKKSDEMAPDSKRVALAGNLAESAGGRKFFFFFLSSASGWKKGKMTAV